MNGSDKESEEAQPTSRIVSDRGLASDVACRRMKSAEHDCKKEE